MPDGLGSVECAARAGRVVVVVVVEGAEALMGVISELSDRELVAAVCAAVVLITLVRTAFRRRGPRPAPGEVWLAQVPFDDGTGSKDRPVLVLFVDGRTLTVARFTSQDRGARSDHRRVPDGLRGLQRSSWVNLQPVSLPRRSFRRRVARPDPILVHWYLRESGSFAAG